MEQPFARRPSVPAGYGVASAGDPPGTRLPWPTVFGWLVEARTYWICTTRPDGRPHAVPVWAVWLDGALYFSTDAASGTGRNLAVNPSVVVHPDNGDKVAIMEGTARQVSDHTLLVRFTTEVERKYDWPMDPDTLPGLVYALAPARVLSWDATDSLGETMTRWEP